MHPDELGNLNSSLRERVRVVSEGDRGGRGRFILYWMHHALRGHDNPALNTAIHAANALQTRLLVYCGLSERHPFASDRHHTFFLQGVRDVLNEMRAREIPAVCHVEREGARGPWLRELAAQAALLVTDEMPVEPITGWLSRLKSSVGCPIWAVDASCVVPLPLAPEAPTRAFRFRDATQRLRDERLGIRFDDLRLQHPEMPLPLPFVPVNLETSPLAELVGRCRIDHSVGPVPHTPGGSQAGGRRWDQFVARRLSAYARDRNDALKPGVSRMSAYLHYGMVSPFRMVREVLSRGGAGAGKFLDELLVWRELAWAFCFHRPDHETVAALPGWARETLRQHESDRRPLLADLETLARARTGDALWDAAQRSLLVHGELHNNVRMTWGKAILDWTPNASAALQAIIDLNHRYALDGRDPASCGGILWCLGQFDRPFRRERPILGSVRSRSTRDHARRLDTDRYRALVDRPLSPECPRVAVVGAGVAGLACARTLADHGISVTIWDRGRAPGGRMASRMAPDSLQGDHGCQYFTARDPRFRRVVDAWEQQGVVAEWTGRVVRRVGADWSELAATSRRLVGQPHMRAVCEHLARDLRVHSEVRVDVAERRNGQWRLIDTAGRRLGDFDTVIVATPPPQAVDLLDTVPRLAARARSVRMASCWSAVVRVADPVDFPAEAALCDDAVLSWIARDSGKPGRDRAGETWVLQATADWSRQHVTQSPEWVAARLQEAFSRVAGESTTVTDCRTHRWRYAIPENPLREDCLFDERTGMGACGDWCGGSRVEHAYLSGVAAAGAVLRRLPEPPADAVPAKQRQLFSPVPESP